MLTFRLTFNLINPPGFVELSGEGEEDSGKV